MSAAPVIPFPGEPVARAAARALRRRGGGAGAGTATDTRRHAAAAARAPRGAADDHRSLEFAAGAARARCDGIDSKKEKRS
jgi:hypothetical protein